MLKKTLAILCVMTGAAYADGDVSVSVGSDIRALHSDSANALTGDSLVGGQLEVPRIRLPIELVPNLSLWAEAGFVGSSAQGTLFNSLNTDVSTSELTAGLQARYRVYRRRDRVRARADFGAARATTCRSLRRRTRWRARATTHGARSRAAHSASELMAIDGGEGASRWDIGLRIEFGYTQASKIALSPTPDHPNDDTLRLPMMEASLGHLDLSGPTFSGGIVGHF